MRRILCLLFSLSIFNTHVHLDIIGILVYNFSWVPQDDSLSNTFFHVVVWSVMHHHGPTSFASPAWSIYCSVTSSTYLVLAVLYPHKLLPELPLLEKKCSSSHFEKFLPPLTCLHGVLAMWLLLCRTARAGDLLLSPTDESHTPLTRNPPPVSGCLALLCCLSHLSGSTKMLGGCCI